MPKNSAIAKNRHTDSYLPSTAEIRPRHTLMAAQRPGVLGFFMLRRASVIGDIAEGKDYGTFG